MTKKKEVEIMRKLAKRNQNNERRAIATRSFQAKQKAAQLNNELMKLEKSLYYTSERDQTARKAMLAQIKDQLASTVQDIVPVLPPVIYR